MRNAIAVGKAEAVAAEHGSRDPFEIARRLGYRLFYERLPAGVEEMVAPDARVMFLPPECERRPERARRLVAHALGHHHLHEGSALYASSVPPAFFAKNERQAEAFAVTLLEGRAAGEVY